MENLVLKAIVCYSLVRQNQVANHWRERLCCSWSLFIGWLSTTLMATFPPFFIFRWNLFSCNSFSNWKASAPTDHSWHLPSVSYKVLLLRMIKEQATDSDSLVYSAQQMVDAIWLNRAANNIFSQRICHPKREIIYMKRCEANAKIRWLFNLGKTIWRDSPTK